MIDHRRLVLAISLLALATLSPVAAQDRAAPEDCVAPTADAPVIARSSRGAGYTVDPCGVITSDAGRRLALPPTAAALVEPSTQLTIDSFTTGGYDYLYDSHAADGPLTIVGPASDYVLSDGSTWYGGSGFNVGYQVRLDHVEVENTTVRYFLTPPISGRLYQQTEYDNGYHSAQGTLNAVGPLVLEATLGSSSATLHGQALIVANDATFYGEPRFNYYTSVPGSVVAFETTISLYGLEVWDEATFSRAFEYRTEAEVDFANPVSSPAVMSLAIQGPSRVHGGSAFVYSAAATFVGGGTRNVSVSADWSVDPSDAASIASGVLTTGALGAPEELLTISASYTHGATVEAHKDVRFLAQDPIETPNSWPMYQADARHTGFIGSTIDPTVFTLLWQRDLGPGQLSGIAAGEGKVFLSGFVDAQPTSVIALKASDGATLWSRAFGTAYLVDAPSFGHGNVYAQISDGTGRRLHAFDANDGTGVFDVPTSSLVRSYAAPTLADGHVFVASEGEMQSLDAFTGGLVWSANVPSQYDGWTPSVDDSRAWEYSISTPGLWSLARANGDLDLYIPDPTTPSYASEVVSPTLGDHDDAFVIEERRLVSFDTAAGSVRWQVVGQFVGQPSVHGDRVYAANGGILEVRDEVTSALDWSWPAAEGAIVAPIVVTPSYVFLSTPSAVHAISLDTHQEVWWAPVSGRLAIADSTLYVMNGSGKISAFGAPPPPPATSLYTLTPCRIFDTRVASGESAGSPSLLGGSFRIVQVTGKCGIPSGVRSISANVTVIAPSTAGILDLTSQQGAPLLPVVGFNAGQVRANNAFLQLDTSGSMTAYVDGIYHTSVDVAIDVNGYFQ